MTTAGWLLSVRRSPNQLRNWTASYITRLGDGTLCNCVIGEAHSTQAPLWCQDSYAVSLLFIGRTKEC